ncbi:hypothetical protein EGH22_19710 [Halomicroarcula sp. F28]|uniref:hypothetical protein n=1 Tax=Haloarcula salinisoli TaxID=2487746 RepID=UPI001C73E0DC|nr:hypothetical protein [Halomicroarcula salinisoli]MBX0288561.1 hypothetical protein [Halomicroarcula salinisoli]
MGRDNWLLGMVCFDTVPETPVKDVLEAFLQNSFSTHAGQAQDLEAVEERIYGDSEVGSESESSSPDGSVKVWYDVEDGYKHSNRNYTIDFRLSGPADDIAPITIRCPGDWLDHTIQDHDVQAQIEALVDAFEAIAEAIDPWMAILAIMPDGRKVPEGHPPDHGIEKLPFVTVFGEESFDHIGDREHVLDAPVYETRSLDTGSVLVRTRDVLIVKHPDEGPSGSPEKHLFEGLSADDRQRFVDPFRELEDGALATDPVMCEAHAPFEWGEMDYRLFPDLPDRDEHCHVICVRREGSKLWEAHNGEFIRRLVDENGQPIGDLPESVPPHQEFISTAIRSAYEEDPPMHMYRMDSTEEPSVYARVRGMDAVRQGESIWEDRDTPAATREQSSQN